MILNKSLSNKKLLKGGLNDSPPPSIIKLLQIKFAKHLKGKTCLLPVERYKQGNIKYTGNLVSYIYGNSKITLQKFLALPI